MTSFSSVLRHKILPKQWQRQKEQIQPQKGNKTKDKDHDFRKGQKD